MGYAMRWLIRGVWVLLQEVDKLVSGNRDDPIVVYCRSGGRSNMAMELLKREVNDAAALSPPLLTGWLFNCSHVATVLQPTVAHPSCARARALCVQSD
jgi:hypothetical protein